MLLFRLAVGDVADHADDPQRGLRVIGDQNPGALHPAKRAGVGTDDAVFGLIAAVDAEPCVDGLPQARHIVGMNQAERHIAALPPRGTDGKACQGPHPLTDEYLVLGNVPFELAQSRRVEGQFDPAMVEAGFTPGVDGLGVVGQHVARQGGEVFQREAFSLGVLAMRQRVTDRQYADDFPSGGCDRRAGIEPDIHLVQPVKLRDKAGVKRDVRANDQARIPHHQVGKTAGPGILAGGHADAGLVPEPVRINEHDRRPGGMQHQGCGPGDPVEAGVRAAVQGV